MTPRDDALAGAGAPAPGERLPSLLVALLPAGAPRPAVTEVLAGLERSPLPLGERRMADAREVAESRWELDLEVRWEEGPRTYRVWAESAQALDDVHLELGRLTPAEREATRACDWSLGVAADFSGSPLHEYHRQLQVLHTLAPEAVLCYDISACWPRPGAWLREAAAAATPPSPTALFSIHAVSDEAGRRRKVWLHTHGLLRCGCIELEMLEIPSKEAPPLSELLNATAGLFLDEGTPPPGEPFVVGHGIELLWLPWPTGVTRFSRRATGSFDDRDEIHAVASGVLFAPGRRFLGLFGRRYGSPRRYLPLLEGDPLLFVSSLETARMARLALERLDRFRRLQARFGDRDDWLFLVKLGYEIDDAASPEDREHLWFQVHALSGDTVEATLLNQPYSIARLHEGEQGPHSLALLTDWSILCEQGRFDADSVERLETELGLTNPSGSERGAG